MPHRLRFSFYLLKIPFFLDTVIITKLLYNPVVICSRITRLLQACEVIS